MGQGRTKINNSKIMNKGVVMNTDNSKSSVPRPHLLPDIIDKPVFAACNTSSTMSSSCTELDLSDCDRCGNCGFCSNDGRSSTVCFGTVTIREYERKIDVVGGMDLGLAIGWNYVELEPVPLDSIEAKDSYGPAELKDEVQRAYILMATGYTRGELREALNFKLQRNRRGSEDTKVAFSKILRKPAKMMKMISGGARRFSVPSFRKCSAPADDTQRSSAPIASTL
eukprot:jgi/Psemu1/13643/gm1.13643_g